MVLQLVLDILQLVLDILTVYLMFWWLKNLYLLSKSVTLGRIVMRYAFNRDYLIHMFNRKPKILPDTHVQSIRARSIFQDIIQVVLDKRKESGDFHGKDLKHLDGLDWEVVVTDASYPHACGYAHGVIVIHQEYLKLCTTDEIATIIAQVVGHLVATPQHAISIVLDHICEQVVYKIPVPGRFKKVKDDMLFYQRQCVHEADHIGMMLMAIAGYDPRAALAVYEDMGQLSNDVDDFLRLIPTANKRAQYLRPFMKEAITIYRSSNKFSDGS